MNKLPILDILPLLPAVGSLLVLSVAAMGTKRSDNYKAPGSGRMIPISSFGAFRLGSAIALSLSFGVTSIRRDTQPSGLAFSGTLTVTIVYGVLLTFLFVLGRGLGSCQVNQHANFVFLCVFGLVAYRDFWPFFTFEGSRYPLGVYTVVEDTLLGILGIVIPFLSPREHRPVHSVSPTNMEPHPEQTASRLSFLLYSWLNPLIKKAYNSHHLAADALFPLADCDRVVGLVSRNPLHPESHLRPHIFFYLTRAFSSDCATLVLLSFLQVILNLASPFALEQSLRHLETQGKGATIRPIVWIILLFLSPVAHSIVYQWSTFTATRVAVHTEALVSDSVFKHTLRIRPQSGENSDVSSDGNKSSNQANLVGTIQNHVTTDLTNITGAIDYLPNVIGVPLHTILCIVYLYRILGWSALIGAASMVVLLPVPGYISSLIQNVEAEKMKKTDSRVQLVSETMTVIRMIKLFGWECKICDRIQDQRLEELAWTKKRSLLQFMTNMISFIIPNVTMLITYTVYTLVAKQRLTASVVFSSFVVFDVLQIQLHVVTHFIPSFLQGKVSLDRINTFLLHDDTVIEPPGSEGSVPRSGDIIGVSHATFSWTKSEPGSETFRNERFILDVPGELVFQCGELNLVIGPTGSGKTSLLMALLGEMHFQPNGPTSWYNLPRHLGVAYAAQESWILNRTIRDNIVFGSDFDERRYAEVLSQCALEPDLALLEYGDLTEVGERGVTLSGGQKARITLARAIYSSAEILLLDDVFAALDVHTSQWIVDHCFRGKLVKGRTIIMTTHNISLVSDIARYVVALNNEGRVQSLGPLKDGYTNASDVVQEVDLSSNDSDSTLGKRVPSVRVEGGTLTTAEEMTEGHVGWSAIILYLRSWGGRAPILNWALYVFGLSATYTVFASQSWYLGYWAEQYQKPVAVNAGQNITIYALIVSCTVTIYSLSFTFDIFRSIRASKVIHNRLIKQIFGATFRWLDTTPVARVLTRCTQDVGAVDGMFSSTLSAFIEITITMLVKLIAVLYFAPFFAIPCLAVAVVGGWCGQVYMKAELSVKRELSNAKAPLLAHLGTVLAGVVSVRAYGAQKRFVTEYQTYIDHYTRVARPFHALNCWVSIRLEALGASFSASLAAYLMYGRHNINPSNVGFSLNMAVTFSALILHWIITYNNLEVHGNSLERIASYMEIEQEEAESIRKDIPPAYWPATGDLRVENLSARYSSDGPDVLHSLTFHIRSGERVGIVGRTGSGKTSLTLTLLRCLLTEGNVYYDGILTSSIPLESLRSRLTIIPQSAELLNGTIRQNLDPSDQLDDATLYNALRSAGLSEVQELELSSHGSNRLTLDTCVTAGGANLSVGQRQIVALARAMVRESKLLILDEATSAIDHKTDAAIQNSLREMKGATQLIIAHRLHSVMDTDRIIVLDAGRIVEFDTPRKLLQNEEGIFRTLVYASKDKEALLAMAR